MPPEQSTPTPTDQQPSSVRTRERLIRFGLLGVGVILFFIGLQTGKGQQPAATSTVCAQASAAALSYGTQATTPPVVGTPANAPLVATENYANVILQNPQCFSPADRAAAQTILDGARSHMTGQ